MVQRQVHGALWLLYAAKRILSKHEQLAEKVLAAFQGEEKRLIQRLIRATVTGLQGELATILAYNRAATLAEHLVRAFDAELLAQGIGAVTLIYDALDVGFGSDEKSIEMRGRFVSEERRKVVVFVFVIVHVAVALAEQDHAGRDLGHDHLIHPAGDGFVAQKADLLCVCPDLGRRPAKEIGHCKSDGPVVQVGQVQAAPLCA